MTIFPFLVVHSQQKLTALQSKETVLLSYQTHGNGDSQATIICLGFSDLRQEIASLFLKRYSLSGQWLVIL